MVVFWWMPSALQDHSSRIFVSPTINLLLSDWEILSDFRSPFFLGNINTQLIDFREMRPAIFQSSEALWRCELNLGFHFRIIRSETCLGLREAVLTCFRGGTSSIPFSFPSLLLLLFNLSLSLSLFLLVPRSWHFQSESGSGKLTDDNIRGFVSYSWMFHWIPKLHPRDRVRGMESGAWLWNYFRIIFTLWRDYESESIFLLGYSLLK